MAPRSNPKPAVQATTVSSGQVQHLEPRNLKPWERNARKHSKKQLEQIAKSIEAFGFVNPILVDKDNTILAGHGRVEAAKTLGRDTVPCLYIEHLTREQKRAYVLADNKIAQNATWDEDLLSEELKALSEIDLDFEIETTGFSIAEIDSLIEAPEPEEEGDPRDDILPKRVAARVQFGDIWQLGAHRLVCGNSLDLGTIDQLMDSERASMIFTDPPYNVPVDGHVGGKGKIKHLEFAMASGEMSPDEFTGFLRTTFGNLCRHAEAGSIHATIREFHGLKQGLLKADQGWPCGRSNPYNRA